MRSSRYHTTLLIIVSLLVVIIPSVSCDTQVTDFYQLHVEGRVIETGTEAPISGATIYLGAGGKSFLSAPSFIDSTLSLVDGSFELETKVRDVACSELWLTSRAHGFGSFGEPPDLNCSRETQTRILVMSPTG